LRLFIALELPEAVRLALPAPPDPWRAVPRASLHVTLAFLGTLPAAGPVIDAMPAGLPPVGELRARRLLRLPPRRPRVLSVEFEDPSGTCVALQAVVAGSLAAAGLYEPEHRRWLPHVTIGRARGEVDRRAALPPVEPVAFVPERVTLFESRLGRGAGGVALYEPLHGWSVSPAS
jgi:2'-5' RNA ligase